jgi:cation diffusion facilitator family transporter
MHAHDLSPWRHSHRFGTDDSAGERGTRLVMWITAVVMVVEIGAGWWFNSMALLADGWHMSSHAFAIGLSAFAYAAMRRHASDPRFAFGTWKIEVLAGFASALFLLGVAALMVVGSVERLWSPAPIHYREAIAVTVLGLLVNLFGDHGHDHGTDLNLKSAYLHVLADAATSVLAIVALVGGWVWGWAWLDPAMGIVGAALVAHWARGLLKETGRALLDREMDHPVVAEIREGIEQGLADSHTRVVDLHVWRVGRNVYSCALAVVTHSPTLGADDVRATFSMHEEIVHSTIEVQRCTDGVEDEEKPRSVA